jgi:hypothetical protein
MRIEGRADCVEFADVIRESGLPWRSSLTRSRLTRAALSRAGPRGGDCGATGYDRGALDAGQ